MTGDTGKSSGLVPSAAQNKGKKETTKGLVHMRQIWTLSRSGKNPNAPQLKICVNVTSGRT